MFLLVGMAAAAVSAAAAEGRATRSVVAYRPSLVVTTGQGVARDETRFAITSAFGAPATAEVELLIPPGYQPSLSQPVGAGIGTVSGYANDRGATPPYGGTIIAADPHAPTAGCDTSAHEAVWGVSLSNAAGSSFGFTIYVSAAPDGTSVLHWCLPSTAPQLNYLAFDLHGVFTPPTRGSYIWDGRFAPYDPSSGSVIDSEQVSALALVRLPQVVRLRANYARRTHRYVLHGTVTEDGKPVRARILVSRSVAGRPFFSTRAGVTRSNAAGVFTLSGRLSAQRVVAFRANAVADFRDISKSCVKDINNDPCVHETLSVWQRDSNTATVRP